MPPRVRCFCAHGFTTSGSLRVVGLVGVDEEVAESVELFLRDLEGLAVEIP